MTEPVARTSVRRTVRVAVALVAGQSLLCAVIGWVTFGSGHPHKPASAPTVEPLAGKPLLVPPPVVVPPDPPRPSATPSHRRTDPTSPTSAPRTSTRPPRPLSAPSPPPTGQPAKPSSPGLPALVLPSSSGDDEVQSPVKLGDLCDPVGAKGLTAAGVSLLCVKGDDGTLRWQIN